MRNVFSWICVLLLLLALARGVRAGDDPPAPKPKAPVPGTTQPVAPVKQPVNLVRNVPKPPFAWLAPYADRPTTPAMFATLRERLFRTYEDATLIRGCSWLIHATTQEVRIVAGRILADSYLLGDHLGADPVPALRLFARDPDPLVRISVLSNLSYADSPLARELLFQNFSGEIPTPPGEGGQPIRATLKKRMWRFGSEEKLEELRVASKETQRAWFDQAKERPAGKTGGRFETNDITVGRESGDVLKCLDGTSLWVTRPEVERTTGGVGSSDVFMLWTERRSGRRGWRKGGGSVRYPYEGGLTGYGKVGVFMRARYLGDDYVRYWVRVDRTGRAVKHKFRRRKP